MSRFFSAATYDYDDDEDHSGLSSSSDEESLHSVSSDSSMDLSSGEEDLGEESDDSFFHDSDESDLEDDLHGGKNGNADYDDDSDSKPYGPDWFKKTQFRKGPPQNKFLKSVESSDDSDLSSDNGNESDWDSENGSDNEDGKKVVKSARDKLLDEMKVINNFLSKSSVDHSNSIKLLDNFDSLLKLHVRSIQQNFGTPQIFVETLINYNNTLKSWESNVEEGTNLQFESKSIAKAFNVLKQRVKKSIKENQDFINEDGTVAVESIESTMSPVPVLGGVGTTTATTTSGAGVTNFQELLENTSKETLFDTLQFVIDSRGKKNVAATDLVTLLEGTLNIENVTPYQKIMIYLTLIPIRLESTQQMSYQPLDQWMETFNCVSNFLTLLETDASNYNVSEFAKYNDNLTVEPTANEQGIIPILGSVFAFFERLDDEFNKSLLNIDPHSSDYLIRLKDETKLYSLLLRVQLYMEKIYSDKHPLALNRIIIKRLNHIYYKTNVIATNLETLAWKQIPQVDQSSSSIINFSNDKDYVSILINKLVETISNNIEISKNSSEINNFANDNDDDLIRSGLFKIYYHALNLTYQFNEIKDMLMTLNVNKVRSKSTSTSLQILFNRVVVQLGLCAFKSSLIEECHEVLNELLSSSHLREILGQQSLQRLLHQQQQQSTTNSSSSSSSAFNIRSNITEQCLPFHKHINMDLVDVVFMTCSLIIEIPSMTAFYTGIKIKKTPYNVKSIRRILEHFDKQNYQPPAETSRDLILFAAKAMQVGDWKKCVDYLLNIKIWTQLQNNQEILKNLQERIKLESLKTYLFTYRRFYNNLAVAKLMERFELSKDVIIEEIPKMIEQFEITFIKLDDSKDSIIIEKADEITKLEEIAIKLNKEYKINKERLFPQRH